MAFEEPSDLTEPEDDELLPDGWFEEPETAPPQDDWMVEPEAALPAAEEEGESPPPFEETRAPLDYSACADAQHQEWVRENIMLRERANAALQRNMGIIMNLRHRRGENQDLRQQLDTVIEYVDILSGFLEILKEKTQQNGCILCGWEPGARTDVTIQTEELGSQGTVEDAFYFLEERLPLWSTFHASRGYITPGGIIIPGGLREEFYALRKKYRD
jgi:hypothetical protein